MTVGTTSAPRAARSPAKQRLCAAAVLGAVISGLCAPVLPAHAENAAGADPEEVVVKGQRTASPSEPTPLAAKLFKVAGTFGDPLRAVAALPGVLQPNEGGGDPAVRGSSPDDNSYLVDGLPAGYVFHDLGNSIFNEDVVRDFGFAAAGFGARYGEASGALFDIALRTPRNEPRAVTVDLSMLRAGVLLESRITDRQAFYVSLRESLVHLLLGAAYGDDERREDDIAIDRYPRARDMQAKYTWQAGEHHNVSVVALGAADDAALTFGAQSDRALIDPGSRGAAATTTAFTSGGASWAYRDGDLAITTRVGRLSRSEDQLAGDGNEYIDLDVDQWTAKSQVEFPPMGRQRVALGVERRAFTYDYAVRFRYRSCTSFSPDCETTHGELTESVSRQEIGITEAFVEDRWRASPAVDVVAGLRYSRDDYLHDEFLEPRLAVAWRYRPAWELHASWGRYHQLPAIQQIVPVFGNPELQSLKATHYVVGVGHELGEDWSVSAEVYRKDLDDLVVEVAAPMNYVNDATGEARGLELMIERENAGRWYGWATLSLARTERRNGLTGETAYFDTDTPVIANVVTSYALTPIWNVGFRWQYRSGMPYSPIVGNRENPDFPGFYLPVYGELNTARADAYHRLDLRLERPIRLARGVGLFYVDIVNVYARTNTGAAAYEPVPDSAEYRLEEKEGLPFLPSVGFKVTF